MANSPGYSGAGMTPSGSIRFEVIGEAFNQVKANMATWVVSILLFAIISYAIQFVVMIPIQIIVSAMFSSNSSGALGAGMIVMLGGQLIGMIISAIVTGFLMAGLIRMAFNQLRGMPIAVGDLFNAKDVAPQAIIGMVLVQLCVSIGSIFCLIPGLIMAGLLFLTLPIIVEQKIPAVEAMKKSMEVLKPHLMMAILFIIVLYFCSIIGAVACGIGVLFTLPILPNGLAIVYRDFFGLDGGAPAYGGGPSPYPRDPNQAPPQ